MVRNRLILPLLALGAALAGCSAPAVVTQKEDILATSGFTVVPANTPERRPNWRCCHITGSCIRCATATQS